MDMFLFMATMQTLMRLSEKKMEALKKATMPHIGHFKCFDVISFPRRCHSCGEVQTDIVCQKRKSERCTFNHERCGFCLYGCSSYTDKWGDYINLTENPSFRNRQGNESRRRTYNLFYTAFEGIGLQVTVDTVTFLHQYFNHPKQLCSMIFTISTLSGDQYKVDLSSENITQEEFNTLTLKDLLLKNYESLRKDSQFSLVITSPELDEPEVGDFPLIYMTPYSATEYMIAYPKEASEPEAEAEQ